MSDEPAKRRRKRPHYRLLNDGVDEDLFDDSLVGSGEYVYALDGDELVATKKRGRPKKKPEQLAGRTSRKRNSSKTSQTGKHQISAHDDNLEQRPAPVEPPQVQRELHTLITKIDSRETAEKPTPRVPKISQVNPLPIPVGPGVHEPVGGAHPVDQTYLGSVSLPNKEESFIYQIEQILHRKTLTVREWRRYLSAPKYHTNEITRGSVWLVEDDVYYDDKEGNGDKLITRYLVKWGGMSYLHVSWELPDDLTDESICVLAATHMANQPRHAQQKKAQHLISDVDERIKMGLKLYPDLAKGEYFPREFLQVECVLGVEKRHAERQHGPAGSQSSEATGDQVNASSTSLSSCHNEHDPDANYSVLVTESPRAGLHGVDIALHVKWRGLPSSFATTELIADLQASCVEYEGALRDFLYNRRSRPITCQNFFVDFANPAVYSTYTRALRARRPLSNKGNLFLMSNVPPIVCTDEEDGSVVDLCDIESHGHPTTRAYLEDPHGLFFTHGPGGIQLIASTTENDNEARLAETSTIAFSAAVLKVAGERSTHIEFENTGVFPLQIHHHLQTDAGASSSPKSRLRLRYHFPNNLTLLPHQTEAVRWLSRMWGQRKNAALCDEEGLGYNTTIAALLHVLHASVGTTKPYMLIVPSCQLEEMEQLLKRWTELPVHVLEGRRAPPRANKDTGTAGRSFDIENAAYLVTASSLTNTYVTTGNGFEVNISAVEWGGILWTLEGVTHVHSWTARRQESLLLRNRAQQLDKVGALFGNVHVHWWCIIRCGVVTSLSNTIKRPMKDARIGDALNGKIDMSNMTEGIPLARYTADLYAQQLPSKPMDTCLLGSLNVLPPEDACGITVYAADFGEDVASRMEDASKKLQEADIDLVKSKSLLNLSVTELQNLKDRGSIVPSYLIRAKQHAIELVIEEVRRAEHVRGRAKMAVDTVKENKGTIIGDVVNVLTAIAHETGLKVPHMPNNPMTLPLSWGSHIYSEELYLILAFLYPGRYIAGLDSLEMTMVQEQEDRMNMRLARVMSTLHCSEEEAFDHLAKGEHLFLPDKHGEFPSSPLFQSCEDPINLPVMSRLYATTVAAYAESKLKAVESESISVPAKLAPFAEDNLRAAKLALCNAPSHPILRTLSSATLAKWAKEAVGSVYSTTVSVGMTPLQLRIALRLVLTAYAAGSLRNMETDAATGTMSGIDSMLSDYIPEENSQKAQAHSVLCRLFKILRLVSLDAGLVAPLESGDGYGNRITPYSLASTASIAALGTGDVRERKAREIDDNTTCSKSVSALCASSSKLAYLRSLLCEEDNESLTGAATTGRKWASSVSPSSHNATSSRSQGSESSRSYTKSKGGKSSSKKRTKSPGQSLSSHSGCDLDKATTSDAHTEPSSVPRRPRPTIIISQSREALDRIGVLLGACHLAYARVDDSTEKLVFQREVAHFSVPPQDCQSYACDVLLVGIRYGSTTSLVGLTPCFLRATTVVLYDGVVDDGVFLMEETGINSSNALTGSVLSACRLQNGGYDSALIREIMTMRNGQNCDCYAESAASHDPTRNPHVSREAQEGGPLVIVRLMAADSVEELLARALVTPKTERSLELKAMIEAQVEVTNKSKGSSRSHQNGMASELESTIAIKKMRDGRYEVEDDLERMYASGFADTGAELQAMTMSTPAMTFLPRSAVLGMQATSRPNLMRKWISQASLMLLMSAQRMGAICTSYLNHLKSAADDRNMTHLHSHPVTARAANMAKHSDEDMPAAEGFLLLCRTLRSYHDDNADTDQYDDDSDGKTDDAEPDFDLTGDAEKSNLATPGKYSALGVADPLFWSKVVESSRYELSRLTLTDVEDSQGTPPSLNKGGGTDSAPGAVCPYSESDLEESVTGDELLLLCKGSVHEDVDSEPAKNSVKKKKSSSSSGSGSGGGGVASKASEKFWADEPSLDNIPNTPNSPMVSRAIAHSNHGLPVFRADRGVKINDSVPLDRAGGEGDRDRELSTDLAGACPAAGSVYRILASGRLGLEHAYATLKDESSKMASCPAPLSHSAKAGGATDKDKDKDKGDDKGEETNREAEPEMKSDPPQTGHNLGTRPQLDESSSNMDILDAQFYDILVEQMESELSIAVEQKTADVGEHDRRPALHHKDLLSNSEGSWLGLDSASFGLLSPEEINGGISVAQAVNNSKEVESREIALQRIHEKLKTRRVHFLEWMKQIGPMEGITMKGMNLFTQSCMEEVDLRKRSTLTVPSIKCVREHHHATARLAHCQASGASVDISAMERVVLEAIRAHQPTPTFDSGAGDAMEVESEDAQNNLESLANVIGSRLYTGTDVSTMRLHSRGRVGDGVVTIGKQGQALSYILQEPLAISLVNHMGFTLHRIGGSTAGAVSVSNMENACIIRVPEYSTNELTPHALTRAQSSFSATGAVLAPTDSGAALAATDSVAVLGVSGIAIHKDPKIAKKLSPGGIVNGTDSFNGSVPRLTASPLPKNGGAPMSSSFILDILQLRYGEVKWLQAVQPMHDYHPRVAFRRDIAPMAMPASPDSLGRVELVEEVEEEEEEGEGEGERPTEAQTAGATGDPLSSQPGSLLHHATTEESGNIEARVSGQTLAKLGRLMSSKQRDALVMALLRFGYGNWSAVESSADCLHPDYVPDPPVIKREAKSTDASSRPDPPPQDPGSYPPPQDSGSYPPPQDPGSYRPPANATSAPDWTVATASNDGLGALVAAVDIGQPPSTTTPDVLHGNRASTLQQLQTEREHIREIAPSRQVLVYWATLVLRGILCCLCNEIESPSLSSSTSETASSDLPDDEHDHSASDDAKVNTNGVVTGKVDVECMWKVMKESHTARFILAACREEKLTMDFNNLDHPQDENNFIKGFPLYGWSREHLKRGGSDVPMPVGVHSTMNDDFLTRLGDAAEGLSTTWHKLFPPCLLSPFFYTSMLRLSGSTKDEFPENPLDAEDGSMGVSNKVRDAAAFNRQYTPFHDSNDRVTTRPNLATIIFERLDRMMEVHVLYSLHSLKLDYRTSAAAPLRDAPQKSKKGKKTKEKVGEGKRTKSSAHLTAKAQAASFLLANKQVAAPYTDQHQKDTERGEKPGASVERRISLHAPSLLVALLAHEGETSECLARGRLPLGNLIGTAQDLAVLASAARTGWPAEDRSLERLFDAAKSGSAAVSTPYLIHKDDERDVRYYCDASTCTGSDAELDDGDTSNHTLPREALGVQRKSSATKELRDASTSTGSFVKMYADAPFQLEQFSSVLSPSLTSSDTVGKKTVLSQIGHVIRSAIDAAVRGESRACYENEALTKFSYGLPLHGRPVCEKLLQKVPFSTTNWGALNVNLWNNPSHLPLCVREHLEWKMCALDDPDKDEGVKRGAIPDQPVGSVPPKPDYPPQPASPSRQITSSHAPDERVSLADLSRRLRSILALLMPLIIPEVSQAGLAKSNVFARAFTVVSSLLDDDKECEAIVPHGGPTLAEVVLLPKEVKDHLSSLQARGDGAAGGAETPSSLGSNYSDLESMGAFIAATWTSTSFEKRLVTGVMKFGFPRSIYGKVASTCQAFTTVDEFAKKCGFSTAELPLVLLGLSHLLAASCHNGRDPPSPFELRVTSGDAGAEKNLCPIDNKQPRCYHGITSPLLSLVDRDLLVPRELEKYSAGVVGCQAVLQAPEGTAEAAAVDEGTQSNGNSGGNGSESEKSANKANRVPLDMVEYFNVQLDAAFRDTRVSDVQEEDLTTYDSSYFDEISRDSIDIYLCRVDTDTFSQSQYPLDPPRPSVSDEVAEEGSDRASSTNPNARASVPSDNRWKLSVVTSRRKDSWHDTLSIQFANLHCLRTSMFRSTVLSEGPHRLERNSAGPLPTSRCHADEDVNAMRLATPSPATTSLQRLIDTVEIIDATRLVVMCATIPPHLHSIACVAAQMPTWWQTAHTISLLKGVCKHGWCEWEKIIYDDKLAWELPTNYKDTLKMTESQHQPVLYGRAYFDSSAAKSSKYFASESNDLAQSIEKDLASVTVPNKPMSLLLQNLSSHQLEKVSRITALNYVEALLSWSAPIPPPVSILREMEIKEIMSPPSPVEIVYFYIKHERFPKHEDRRKIIKKKPNVM